MDYLVNDIKMSLGAGKKVKSVSLCVTENAR